MFYSGEEIMLAAGATALLVIVLTLYAFCTKVDFTICGGILTCVLFVFVLFGLLVTCGELLGLRLGMLNLALSCFGVLLFSVYLIYDTQVNQSTKEI